MMKQEHTTFFTVVQQGTSHVVKYIRPKKGNACIFGTFRSSEEAIQEFRSVKRSRTCYIKPTEYDQIISAIEKAKAEPQFVQLPLW